MDDYIHLDTVFESGSYKNWTGRDVAQHDPWYIHWLDRDTNYLVGEDVIVEAQLALERAARGQCKGCEDD